MEENTCNKHWNGIIIGTINGVVPNGMLIGIILDVNMVSWENPQKSRVFQGKILELIGECGAAKPRLNSKRGLIERLRTQLKKSLKWGYAIYTLVYNITCYMLPNQSLS